MDFVTAHDVRLSFVNYKYLFAHFASLALRNRICGTRRLTRLNLRQRGLSRTLGPDTALVLQRSIGSIRSSRQRESSAKTTGRPVAENEFTAVGLHDRLGDCQAEANAARFPAS